MQKHLKILEQLQKNSKEQNESISQLHKENLENLNRSLIDLYNSKLKQIEKNIQANNSKTIKNLNYELEILRKNKIYKYIGIALISLTIGILATLYLMQNRYKLPEQFILTYKGVKYLKINWLDEKLIPDENDKTIKYIKIGE